jgi:hypothetical protein
MRRPSGPKPSRAAFLLLETDLKICLLEPIIQNNKVTGHNTFRNKDLIDFILFNPRMIWGIDRQKRFNLSRNRLSAIMRYHHYEFGYDIIQDDLLTLTPTKDAQ